MTIDKITTPFDSSWTRVISSLSIYAYVYVIYIYDIGRVMVTVDESKPSFLEMLDQSVTQAGWIDSSSSTVNITVGPIF